MLTVSSAIQRSMIAEHPAGNATAESVGEETLQISVGALTACGKGRHPVIANAIISHARSPFFIWWSRCLGS